MKLPFFPFYPKDYVVDTGHLSLAEHGAYLQLMIHCWSSEGCQIPADQTWIMKRLGCSAKEYEDSVAPILREFFLISDDGKHLINKRLFHEYEKAVRMYQRRQAGAAVTNRKKAKLLENKSSDAQRTLSARSPGGDNITSHDTTSHDTPFGRENASHSPATEASKGKAYRRPDPIPADWKPRDELVTELCGKYNVRRGVILDEADAFRNWCLENAHLAKSRKSSYEAAFRNWVKKGVKPRPVF